MTEGTASTERFERGTAERSPAAGESALSNSVWGEKDVAERFTTLARSKRIATELIMSGESIFIPLLPEFPEIPAAPLKAVLKVSESTSRGIPTSD